MAKYEVMLLVSGDLEESKANKISDDLASIISSTDLKINKLWLKDLAYEIKKNKKAYYYQFNFSSNDSNSIKEFNRLSRINKQVLRNLVINLEKDYGYRATVNPKKIARNEKRAVIYTKVQEELKKKMEERQQQALENLVKA